MGLGRCCCERLRLRLRLRLLRLQRPALLPMATQALQNAPSRRVPGLPQQRALPAVPRVVAQQRPLLSPLPLRALALSGPRLRHSASAPPPCASPSPPPSVPIQRGRFEVSPPQSGRCPAPGMRQVRAAVARPRRPHAMLRAPASLAHLPPPDAWPLLAPLPPPPRPRVPIHFSERLRTDDFMIRFLMIFARSERILEKYGALIRDDFRGPKLCTLRNAPCRPARRRRAR